MIPAKIKLAIYMMTFIAYHSRGNNPISSKIICDKYGLNRRALEPNLQKLTQANLITSIKGNNGGYIITNPEEISLADIINCLHQPTRIHEKTFHDWENLLEPLIDGGGNSLMNYYQKISLADICKKTKNIDNLFNNNNFNYEI